MIPDDVSAFLKALHARILAGLQELDRSVQFTLDPWNPEPASHGVSAVLDNGAVLERAGIGFSHVHGAAMPEAASARHPELVGMPFEAAGVSLVVHPRNPYAPTAHMNVRAFFSKAKSGEPVWWFGGGYDLTPYYPFEDDAREWHTTAKAACDPFGAELYPRLKQQCDAYFFLPHRQEPRGVGGLFFDDMSGEFERSFGLVKSVGDSFLAAYQPIVLRRKETPYGERERAFQLHRRGRYVEFNLVHDRGTRFGLQFGGRIESILLSMPPLAAWRYDWHPPDEGKLLEFLRPRQWIAPS